MRVWGSSHNQTTADLSMYPIPSDTSSMIMLLTSRNDEERRAPISDVSLSLAHRPVFRGAF